LEVGSDDVEAPTVVDDARAATARHETTTLRKSPWARTLLPISLPGPRRWLST